MRVPPPTTSMPAIRLGETSASENALFSSADKRSYKMGNEKTEDGEAADSHFNNGEQTTRYRACVGGEECIHTVIDTDRHRGTSKQARQIERYVDQGHRPVTCTCTKREKQSGR